MPGPPIPRSKAAATDQAERNWQGSSRAVCYVTQKKDRHQQQQKVEPWQRRCYITQVTASHTTCETVAKGEAEGTAEQRRPVPTDS